IPLPPVRPPRAGSTKTPSQANPPATFSLASASSAPAPMPPPSPAEIIRSRGVWTAEAASEPPASPPAQAAAQPASAAPASPGAIGRNGQRFAWLTGPPGRPVVDQVTTNQGSSPPRPPADVPNVDTETTASVSPWPDLNYRVPRDPPLP